MTNRGQYWRETDTHLWIRIFQAWYGAWKKFGWPQDTEGIGLAVEMIYEAMQQKKRLGVELIKYPAKYEITPKKALKYGQGNTFVARDLKQLYVVPITAFDRIPKEDDKT